MSDEYGYQYTFAESQAASAALPFKTPQDGEAPPPYEQFLLPQYAPTTSVIPDDFRAAPSAPADVAPPSYEASTTPPAPPVPFKFKTASDGVSCSDPRLNRDPQELLNFFIAHNEKPGMQVKIWGHHTETRTRTVHRDGRSHTEHYTVTVTDFLTMLDVSQWIHPVGIIQSVPLAEGGNLVNKSIMEVLTDYVQCDNTFKEIHMRKHCVWNYAELSMVIHAAIRQVGFRRSITISYPMSSHKVKVKSDAKIAKAARNPWMRAACIITCLWIIFLPIYCCVRKIFKNSIRSDFAMTITPMQFFQMNYWTIILNVRNRYGGGF